MSISIQVEILLIDKLLENFQRWGSDSNLSIYGSLVKAFSMSWFGADVLGLNPGDDEIF